FALGAKLIDTATAPLAKLVPRMSSLLERVVPPLDPVRLPAQLAAAARRHPGQKRVTVIVPRYDNNHEKASYALPAMVWDASWDGSNEVPIYTTSPLSIPQLGIAYWVTSRIEDVEKDSPAAGARRQVKDKDQDRVQAGVPYPLKRGDVIYRIRFRQGPP